MSAQTIFNKAENLINSDKAKFNALVDISNRAGVEINHDVAEILYDLALANNGYLFYFQQTDGVDSLIKAGVLVKLNDKLMPKLNLS